MMVYTLVPKPGAHFIPTRAYSSVEDLLKDHPSLVVPSEPLELSQDSSVFDVGGMFLVGLKVEGT